jgi:outer membrane translocation and assembly module TamA
VPSRAEAVVRKAQQWLFEDPNGFYPYLGSVYSGGGFTLGAGYRYFYGNDTFVDVRGLYSLRAYKLLEVSTTSRGGAQNRIDVTLRGGWRDATQIGYYGIGLDTLPDATNFRLKQGYAEAEARVRPVHQLPMSVAVGYENYRQEEGTGTTPSIEAEYTPATTPGLGVNPSFVHARGSIALDWRSSPGYSRTGGAYTAVMHAWIDRHDTYSFKRLDVDLVQHLPLLRETWVLSLRGQMQTTLGENDLVPFFLLPSLGSGSTLRGYPSWRFRDRHSLLTSAEWRWIPNRLGLDLALFYDAGKVTSRRRDLDFKGLRSDWGIGVRFHGPTATPLRVEVARGREGWHLVFAGSAAF